MIGQVLCYVGWHLWVARTEHVGDVDITFNRCAREGCPFYADEFVVDIERSDVSRFIDEFHVHVYDDEDATADSELDDRCSCRKGGWNPTCPQHGRVPRLSA